ncbi:hypothetical protein DUNSADRAFT_5382 [Dunaliella salina]|uniref:PI3K/PI4K catalytic domain-containing protein n=1 Tax=Dunaliella salina TaxID=3046 RepID=A0ABQ7GQC1_DUNSA|nr:hypothetical protein DUNSADRAFT_5382 [Dunaliella salina]|eukprot:KAF5836803.1 hypothetical protein DUNSADRAFT_5382 [Dunaliella salina]
MCFAACRHLDNILLDTTSCELVHIDFNVCFEKGLRLRVPEIVPFRLTQAVAAGLGAPGGTEGGAFKSAAEVALGALRARREALVGLLDAVLADPLVDWTSEREGMAARQNLELAVSLSLFVSRLEEVWDALKQQMDELVPLLDGPGSVMAAYCEVHSFLSGLQAREALHAAAAKDAELQLLLQQLQAAQAASFQALHALQAMGAKLYEQCASWTVQHANVLGLVRDESLPEMAAAPSLWQSSDAPVPLGLLRALTQPSPSALAIQAAQPSSLLTETMGPDVAGIPEVLLRECAVLDEQGANLLAARDRTVAGALAAIADYSKVLRVLLPPTYPEQSHHHGWGQALAAMLHAPHNEGWLQACVLIPAAQQPSDVARTWRALHGAHALSLTLQPTPPMLSSYMASSSAPPTPSQQQQQQQQQGAASALETTSEVEARAASSGLGTMSDALAGTVSPSDQHAAADASIASLDDPGSLRTAVQELLAHVTAADSPQHLRMLAMGLSGTAAQMVQVLQPLVQSPSHSEDTHAENGAAGSESGGAAGEPGSKAAGGKAGTLSVEAGGATGFARSSSAPNLTGTTAGSNARNTAAHVCQPVGQAGSVPGAPVSSDYAPESPASAAAAVQQLRSASTQCHGMLSLLQLIQQAGLEDRLCLPANAQSMGGPVADVCVGALGEGSIGPQQQQQEQFERLQGWLQFAVRGLEVGALTGAALQADALVDLAAHVQGVAACQAQLEGLQPEARTVQLALSAQARSSFECQREYQELQAQLHHIKICPPSEPSQPVLSSGATIPLADQEQQLHARARALLAQWQASHVAMTELKARAAASHTAAAACLQALYLLLMGPCEAAQQLAAQDAAALQAALAATDRAMSLPLDIATQTATLPPQHIHTSHPYPTTTAITTSIPSRHLGSEQVAEGGPHHAAYKVSQPGAIIPAPTPAPSTSCAPHTAGQPYPLPLLQQSLPPPMAGIWGQTGIHHMLGGPCALMFGLFGSCAALDGAWDSEQDMLWSAPHTLHSELVMRSADAPLQQQQDKQQRRHQGGQPPIFAAWAPRCRAVRALLSLLQHSCSLAAKPQAPTRAPPAHSSSAACAAGAGIEHSGGGVASVGTAGGHRGRATPLPPHQATAGGSLPGHALALTHHLPPPYLPDPGAQDTDAVPSPQPSPAFKQPPGLASGGPGMQRGGGSSHADQQQQQQQEQQRQQSLPVPEAGSAQLPHSAKAGQAHGSRPPGGDAAIKSVDENMPRDQQPMPNTAQEDGGPSATAPPDPQALSAQALLSNLSHQTEQSNQDPSVETPAPGGFEGIQQNTAHPVHKPQGDDHAPTPSCSTPSAELLASLSACALQHTLPPFLAALLPPVVAVLRALQNQLLQESPHYPPTHQQQQQQLPQTQPQERHERGEQQAAQLQGQGDTLEGRDKVCVTDSKQPLPPLVPFSDFLPMPSGGEGGLEDGGALEEDGSLQGDVPGESGVQREMAAEEDVPDSKEKPAAAHPLSTPSSLSPSVLDGGEAGPAQEHGLASGLRKPAATALQPLLACLDGAAAAAAAAAASQAAHGPAPPAISSTTATNTTIHSALQHTAPEFFATHSTNSTDVVGGVPRAQGTQTHHSTEQHSAHGQAAAAAAAAPAGAAAAESPTPPSEPASHSSTTAVIRHDDVAPTDQAQDVSPISHTSTQPHCQGNTSTATNAASTAAKDTSTSTSATSTTTKDPSTAPHATSVTARATSIDTKDEEETPEALAARLIARLLWRFSAHEGGAAAAAAVGAQLQAALPLLQQHAAKHQQLRLHHTAAFGWMHEHLLTQVVELSELQSFYKRCTWDPLEPSRKLASSSRQHLLETLQRDQAHAAHLFESNLGMLVTGFPDMAANLENLQARLPALSQLLCKDIGSMLKELVTITAKQAAARDVAALASRVVHHHASIAAALDALLAVLPSMLKQMALVEAEAAAAAATTAGREVSAADGDSVAQSHLSGRQKQASKQQKGQAAAAAAAVARARALSMLKHLEEPAQQLQPSVQDLLEAGPSVQQLVSGIEAVSMSASSIATAIQSEHTVDTEGAIGGAATEQAPGPSEVSSGTHTDEGQPPPDASVQGTAASAAAGAANEATASAAAAETSVPGARESLRSFGFSSHRHQAKLHAQQLQQQQQQSPSATQQQRQMGNAYVAWMLRRCILKAEGRDTWDVGALIAGAHRAGSSDAAHHSVAALPSPPLPHTSGPEGSSSSPPAGGAAHSASTPPTSGFSNSPGGAVADGASTPYPQPPQHHQPPQQQQQHQHQQVAAMAAAAAAKPVVPGVMSVAQQVGLLIRQASSADNLAQMYEGWMPWL